MADQTCPANLAHWLDEITSRLNLVLDSQQKADFMSLADLLRAWNEKINLTAIVDDEGIAIRHYLDSLSLLPYLQVNDRLIDVGTGAGFPGFPLKLVRPGLSVVLLDALAKRVKYLEAVISTLQLTGIKALHARAEEAARQPDLRESFDVATARAVAALPVLCEYCLPFVRVGGVFLAMKGQDSENWNDARPAIRKLGGELVRIDTFDLAKTDMKRTILVVRKIAPTPSAYPRKAGRPERDPL